MFTRWPSSRCWWRNRGLGDGSDEDVPRRRTTLHYLRYRSNIGERAEGMILPWCFRAAVESSHVDTSSQVWSAQPSGAQARVSFVAGDFLAPTLAATQLPLGQQTYLIRHVLHDWTDAEVVGILRNVRAAMLASETAGSADAGVLSAQRRKPKLLLCEMLLQERSGRFVYTTSMQLLALNNGKTRTEAEMLALLECAGFEVTNMHAMRAADSIIEATPAL